MDVAKAALVRAMETYFGTDTRRIEHAHRVTAYAESLLGPENGEPAIVLGAAVLHDIGIPMAEKKYGRALGQYQELEGPPIAKEILDRLHFSADQTEEICQIIGHHHSPGRIVTQNFKIVYDADWLVNLKDEYDIRDRHKLEAIIDAVFLTAGGKALARQIYLSET